jgi:hypothetical protein
VRRKGAGWRRWNKETGGLVAHGEAEAGGFGTSTGEERAQLTLQVEGLCELNKALAVKVEQQAAELRSIHLP